MSRNCVRLALGVALSGLICTAVQSQEPGRGRGRGGMGMMMGGGGAGSLVMLASNEEVVKHLKITDEQKAYLKMLGEELREESTKFFGSMGDLSREERMEKIREWAAKQGPEVEKKLTEILTAEKMKRLKQVRLQVEGSRAFADAGVQKELGINEEQKKKLEQIGRDGMAQMMELGRSAGDDPDARRKAMDDFRKDQDGKMMAVLTDAQKAKLTELKGEPIDFKVEMRMGGRGGRGPGGDGAPGEGENKRRKRGKRGGDGDGKGSGAGAF